MTGSCACGVTTARRFLWMLICSLSTQTGPGQVLIYHSLPFVAAFIPSPPILIPLSNILSLSHSETLKNLVLPGVGKFTILDHHNVTAADCTSSFFLTEDYIGKNRAENACALLSELNPDVKGNDRILILLFRVC